MPSIDIRAFAHAPSGHPHRQGIHDYSRNPMLVYWEMTQACGLACRHCPRRSHLDAALAGTDSR